MLQLHISCSRNSSAPEANLQLTQSLDLATTVPTHESDDKLLLHLGLSPPQGAAFLPPALPFSDSLRS